MRALGTSLLDQVLAETVDPAYEQAARERATGQRPAAGSSGRRRGLLVVAGTMLLAGLLVAVTYSQAAAGAQGREEIRRALVADIQQGSELSDDLTAQLDALVAEVDATRDHLLASSVEGQVALARLSRAETAAAATAVTGPGLLVTLANAEPDADSDPVGGTVTEDPRGRVRDGDLQLVVNALWAAGAEAISVNGHRLGPTTAIRFAGEAVLVDFRPVTNPYEIRAVGAPGEMAEGFLANPEVGALAIISDTFGLRFDFAQEDQLSLPAATLPELRLAERAGTAAEPDAGTSGSPADDETPED
jgi:uncharacterized protein YlxW (UPF0749 family)